MSNPLCSGIKRYGAGVVWLVAAAILVTVGVPSAALAQAAAPQERVVNGTFDNGLTAPWWNSANVTLAVVDGRLCATVPGGTVNPWDAIIGQTGVYLQRGLPYRFQVQSSATREVAIRTTVQINVEPYTATFAGSIPVTTEPKTTSFDFTGTLDTNSGQVTFQLGGTAEGYTVCFDNVSLVGGAGGYVPDTGPAVRVNQLGYVPKGPKRATLVTDATAPQAWVLKAADGTVAAKGMTQVFGADVPSGDKAHLIDFSSYQKPGAGYTLHVDKIVSYPFEISTKLYSKLRYDAVEYFYHNRSGIPIEAKYVGDGYARPAGHVGVAPNQGDTKVPCLEGVCDYSLDVSGGWYDAGDHGKYVVNGGIATWQLFNTYERSLASARFSSALRDGTQQIPERTNGVPDLLDEARWEMEFLLRMQVPDGRPNAGMAFHRIHDAAWTGFPMRPDKDPQPRHLHAPSTAATLNLAATAAQCGRIWRQLDPAFSKRCLAAAKKAWQAAVANPAVSAPRALEGGGGYPDGKVSDELYWAAAELFITTGEKTYRDAVTSAPDYKGRGIPADGLSWDKVSALGDLSLAMLPNDLPDSEKAAIRAAIDAAADKLIDTMKGQAYPVPYRPANGQYVWGSNGQVLNQIVLLAAAHDMADADGKRARAEKLRQAAFEAMDYILGRNGLNQSYVTGYGTKASHNQHHRFWAHQVNAAYPNPAPGSVAGGPNSLMEDLVAKGKLTGYAPQKCYIDDIESFSTNEVAINWNSALAWVSAWLADHSD